MATKLSLLVLALLLAPGCIEKKKSEKPKEPTAAAADGDAATADKKDTPGGADDRGDGGEAAKTDTTAEGDDGGPRPPTAPPIPKVPKVQVVTISMGAQDYDVFINPDKTAWRISMKPTAGDLAPLAARAKAMPNAEDGKAKVFLGNSVEPVAGQAMVEALRAAGFKDVEMALPRRP